MTGSRTAISPANLIRNGFDWSGCTARLPYILVVVATLVLASLIPATRNFTGANTAVFVALTILFPIWLGHTRRRLRDAGWSGWLMWLAILPVLGLLLTIFLAFKPGDALNGETGGSYSRLGFSLALACGALMLSRAFWAPYWIPSGSMKPTLLVGDFLAVIPINQPQRGDLVVIQHPRQSAEVIQRVIGLPGEEVQMRDGVVHVDGEALPQVDMGLFVEEFAAQGATEAQPRCSNVPQNEGEVCLKARRLETTPDGRSYVILDTAPQPGDNMETLRVPEGHFFLLGDNRDNVVDSRISVEQGGIGLVSRANLTGRVARVLFSSAGARLLHVWTWRRDRFLLRVR